MSSMGLDAKRRNLPRSGQNLRIHLDRWPPLQDSTPKPSVLHGSYNLIVHQGSDFRTVLLDGHVILSRHAAWGGSEWIDSFCTLQSVRQRHALTLVPRRFNRLCG